MSYKGGGAGVDDLRQVLTGPLNNPELRCRAAGCLSAWAVNCSDRDIHNLCSQHAWADTRQWPAITDNQYRP
jgi:hypothetical protein